MKGSKGKRKIRSYRRILAILICIGLLDKPLFEVRAYEENWENRPLIQATSERDEYEGLVHLGVFRMPLLQEADFDEVYEMTKRCVVRITMRQSAGSGFIWCMEKERMVIVSNRHLLMEAVEGEVTFYNGHTLKGEILGYSTQYDIAFLAIPRQEIPGSMLKDIYEIRSGANRLDTLTPGEKILQVGSVQRTAENVYQGTVKQQAVYIPEFQTFMIQTDCYAREGMSGGGLFDAYGSCLGMVSGGEVAADAALKAGFVTYSIPVSLIEEEYRLIEEE